jgi:hypothetical protein
MSRTAVHRGRPAATGDRVPVGRACGEDAPSMSGTAPALPLGPNAS